MVGLENEPVLLTKYNLAYIWLVSENAPKIVQSVDTDLVKFDAQTDVLNWVYDSLKATLIDLDIPLLRSCMLMKQLQILTSRYSS